MVFRAAVVFNTVNIACRKIDTIEEFLAIYTLAYLTSVVNCP